MLPYREDTGGLLQGSMHPISVPRVNTHYMNAYTYTRTHAHAHTCTRKTKTNHRLLLRLHTLSCLLYKTKWNNNNNKVTIAKERVIRSLENFKVERPDSHAAHYTRLLTAPHRWTKPALLQAAEACTAEQLQEFHRQFIEGPQKRIAFVCGNATGKSSRSMYGKQEEVPPPISVLSSHATFYLPFFYLFNLR